MFSTSADLYDAIYRAMGKDYEREAASVLAHVAAAGLTAPSTLLDVACGTGRHLEVWSRTLTCVGSDLDEALLAVAGARCPGVHLVHADMVDLDLRRQFDVVTCLFSSIGYVGTVERLDRAVAAMARHLAPGGVLVVEPWFQPDAWRVGHVAAVFVDEPDLKVARLNTSGRRGEVATFDFHYLVARGGDPDVRHLVEHHELALFTWAQYRHAFEAAGLTTTVDEAGLLGRGLVIGRRPA